VRPLRHGSSCRSGRVIPSRDVLPGRQRRVSVR
jgi:hypothetical protein